MKKFTFYDQKVKTKPCPICGTPYPVNTGYCVKCKKKVAEPVSEEFNFKVENISGKPFSKYLHADEGQAQTELEPDEKGYYNVNPNTINKYQKNIVQRQDDEDKTHRQSQNIRQKIVKNKEDILKRIEKFLNENN